MKKGKATPPAPEHKLLGITIDVSTNSAAVSPTPGRRDKLRARALTHLAAGSLAPTDAGCLAGKATFFGAYCMGSVGRAATKALHARQHDYHAKSSLSMALSCLLGSNCETIGDCTSTHCTSVHRVCQSSSSFCGRLFHDWLLALRWIRCRRSRIGVPACPVPFLQNGFGVVLFPVFGAPRFFHGSIPTGVLKLLATRKQFIFILGAMAQFSALMTFSEFLMGPYLSFIDNTAKYALAKGFSSDITVNITASIFLGHSHSCDGFSVLLQHQT